MKKLVFTLVVLLMTCSAPIFAQSGRQRGTAPRSAEDMVESQWQRIASEAMLSSEQTKNLADTYKAYRNELRELMPQRNDSAQNAKPSDEEIKANTLKSFSNERKRIDIQEKYFKEFCKTLTPRQASLIINQRGGMQGGAPGREMPRGDRPTYMQRGNYRQ
ncbi:MAG: hypothetical protein II151_01440 [Bacteroidales bacterium]|nr:hypothetical protein [Bacteroidales bacterium]